MITPRSWLEQTSQSRFLWIQWSLATVWLSLALAGLAAEPPAKRFYDVPESDATVSLRLFAEQSGLEIIYPAEDVKGVKTNALKGKFTPGEAIARLIAGTPLTVISTKSGAMAINRAKDPKRRGERQKTTQIDQTKRKWAKQRPQSSTSAGVSENLYD